MKHAILGLVVELPSATDELQRRCRDRFPLDDVPLHEVEALTDSLEREGLIAWTTATNPYRRSRGPAYEATDLGVHEFEAWLREGPSFVGNLAQEALRKIGSGNWSNIDRLIDITYDYERAALRRVAAFDLEETFPARVERVGRWQAMMFEIGRDAEEAQVKAALHFLGRARDWLEATKAYQSAADHEES